MFPDYDDPKKHIKTILEKDKNVDCKQCNLSTRAKWHLRAQVEISHKWFVISGYEIKLKSAPALKCAIWIIFVNMHISL